MGEKKLGEKKLGEKSMGEKSIGEKSIGEKRMCEKGWVIRKHGWKNVWVSFAKKNMGENFAKSFGWQKAWVKKSMGVTLWKNMIEKRKKNTGENFVKNMGKNVVKSMGDKTWVKKAWVKTL